LICIYFSLCNFFVFLILNSVIINNNDNNSNNNIIQYISEKENLNQVGLVSLRKSSIVLFTWHMTIGCLVTYRYDFSSRRCVLSSHIRSLSFNLGSGHSLHSSFFSFPRLLPSTSKDYNEEDKSPIQANESSSCLIFGDKRKANLRGEDS